MNIKTYNKLKSALIRACDKHIKNGGELVSGAFFSGENACCPISCIVGRSAVSDNLVFQTLNQKLGVEIPERQYWHFIDGFDNNGSFDPEKEDQMYELGQLLRQKYILSDKK